MKLIVFGLNHRTAPVHVRESWALSADASRSVLQGLRKTVSPSEHLIISTCNRTEFYSHVPREFFPASPAKAGEPHPRETGETQAPPAVALYLEFYRQFLERCSSAAGASPCLDDSCFYVRGEEDAIEHLFRVASGLDSMILGESQILRQIKESFAIAQGAQATGKFFNKLFPAALRAGKKVRTLTAISDGCITPGQAALKLARGKLGDLSRRSILVVGSGKIATSTALAFREEGVEEWYVVNRTPERAADLVQKIGAGTAVPWSRLEEMLSRVDLIVSSTGAVDPLVPRSLLERIQAKRDHRPLVVVDLAIPRDFDPEGAQVPGVSLFNIDDLNEAIRENVEERHRHIPHAERIVREEMLAFQRWMTYVQVDPVLRHMIERFEQIRLGELQSFISRFPPEYHDVLKEMSSSLVKKLLHFPIEKLKSLRDLRGLNDTEVSFLKHLFLTDL